MYCVKKEEPREKHCRLLKNPVSLVPKGGSACQNAEARGPPMRGPHVVGLVCSPGRCLFVC